MLACALVASLTSAAPIAAGSIGAGATAFVIETSTPLRVDAKDDARAVTQLPIWTAVHVDDVRTVAGEAWAHVTAGPRTLRYDTPGGEPKPVAPSSWDAQWPHGFVPVAALDASPEGRVGLVARAKAASDPERGVFLQRALALDPNDVDVQRLVTATTARLARVSQRDHAPFARADLVAGCRGDVTRATVVVAHLAAHAAQPEPADACAAHVDLRAPCGSSKSEHRALLAKFQPRFPDDGPALRLVPGLGAADRPVYVVTRLVAADGCSDACEPMASSSDVRVDRLRVPRVDDGRTVLHVLVPRYTGALYDIVVSDAKEDVDAEPVRFEIPQSFDVDPRDDAGPGVHLFVAPDACCSNCDEDR